MPGGIIVLALSALYSLFLLIKVESVLGQKFIMISGDNIWTARGIQISDTTYFLLWVIALAGYTLGAWLILSDFKNGKFKLAFGASIDNNSINSGRTSKIQHPKATINYNNKSPISIDEPNSSWIISCLSGPLAGKSVELTAFPIFIGRDPLQSNLIIPPPNGVISKRHCMIRYDKKTRNIFLEDCASTNGTYLFGGEKLDAGKHYLLHNGDQFYLADPDISFKIHKT